MQKAGGLVVLIGVSVAAAINAGCNPGTSSDVTGAAERPPAGTVSDATRTETDTSGVHDMAAETNKVNTVIHASEADFQQKVLNANGSVLLDFYADWCGPCRAIGPVLEQLASEYPTAQIVKVNVDDNPNLAAKYRIESIPALMVFQEGQVVNQHLGVADKAELRALLGL